MTSIAATTPPVTGRALHPLAGLRLSNWLARRLLPLLALVIPVSATAQIDQVPRILPYDGMLEVAGLPVSGDIAVRFALYATPGTNAAPIAGCEWAGNDALWCEEWSNDPSRSCTASDCFVRAFAGRFSVALGTYVNIAPRILDAEALELGLSVRIDDCPIGATSCGTDPTTECQCTWLDLAGRQPIVPVPYAYWSTGAGDLTVTQDVRFVVALVATTLITRTLLSLTGELTTDGAVTAARDIVSRGSLELPDGVADFSIHTGQGFRVDNVLVEGQPLQFGQRLPAAIGFDNGATEQTALTGRPNDGVLFFNETLPDPDVNPPAPRVAEFSQGVHFDGNVTLEREAAAIAAESLMSVGGPLTLGDVTFGGRYRGPQATARAFACPPQTPRSLRDGPDLSCIDADFPLMETRYVAMGSNDRAQLTGIDPARYHCWVGGVAFMGASFGTEQIDQSLLRYHVELPSPEAYWVRADLANHHLRPVEQPHVGVVCLQHGVVTAQSVDWPGSIVLGAGTCSVTGNACDDQADCVDPLVFNGGCTRMQFQGWSVCLYDALDPTVPQDFHCSTGAYGGGYHEGAFSQCSTDADCPPGLVCGNNGPGTFDPFDCRAGTDTLCHQPVNEFGGQTVCDPSPCTHTVTGNVCVICGDGVVGPGEICDDGNRDDTDACTNACQPQGTCVGASGANTFELCGSDAACGSVSRCTDGSIGPCACVACPGGNCASPGGYCRSRSSSFGFWWTRDVGAHPCTDAADCATSVPFSGCDPDAGGEACTCEPLSGMCLDKDGADLSAPCDPAETSGDFNPLCAAVVDGCGSPHSGSEWPCSCAPICGDGFDATGPELCDDGNSVDDDLCSNTCQPQGTCVSDATGLDTFVRCGSEVHCTALADCTSDEPCTCVQCPGGVCPDPPTGTCVNEFGDDLAVACTIDADCVSAVPGSNCDPSAGGFSCTCRLPQATCVVDATGVNTHELCLSNTACAALVECGPDNPCTCTPCPGGTCPDPPAGGQCFDGNSAIVQSCTTRIDCRGFPCNQPGASCTCRHPTGSCQTSTGDDLATACFPGSDCSGVQGCGGFPPCVCATTCGNGIVEGSEECDDGNADDTDFCTSTCQFNGTCFDSAGAETYMGCGSAAGCLALDGCGTGDPNGPCTCEACFASGCPPQPIPSVCVDRFGFVTSSSCVFDDDCPSDPFGECGDQSGNGPCTCRGPTGGVCVNTFGSETFDRSPCTFPEDCPVGPGEECDPSFDGPCTCSLFYRRCVSRQGDDLNTPCDTVSRCETVTNSCGLHQFNFPCRCE